MSGVYRNGCSRQSKKLGASLFWRYIFRVHFGNSKMKQKQTVILLHGIGHSLWNMILIEKTLLNEGYATLNLTYPSLRNDIHTLSGWLGDRLSEKRIWEESDKVHFVTHSMGGLVAGFYLGAMKEKIPEGKMGRVVMLGPPHGGSEVADFLHKNILYKFVFGPAGQQLTTTARQQEKITPFYELGIIAGCLNWAYPFGLFCIRDVNDGCVSVENTKLTGMKDHIVLPVLHGIMGWSREVHRQVVSFLESGKFS
jgi:pimeloyl-ACP methyl ester carboxylesterase